MELPLPFEVRESGGGLHVLANLKEAYENGTEHFRRAEELRTGLMTLMGGDPAPNHSAALLRVVGSHNSKYGEPFEVSVTRAGEPVDIVDVEAFLDLYAEPLFELKEGYLPTSNVVSLDVPFVPIDTDAVLGDMPATGEGVNAVQYRLLRALIVRDGMTPQEAVDAVVGATMTMAAAHQPDWTFDVEFKCVTARMKWVLGRLEKEHWAAVDAGRRVADEPPDWLPLDWRAPWTAGCKAGGTPHVHRNGHGYCIRTAGAAKTQAPPDSEEASAAASDTAEQPRERHYRFRLVDFEDMIPDEVSHYLVDELLPEKGIGMVWGKPKCLKSFCVLDICFHIARGWPYHDRAVKQGGVVYCAFEGGYGHKKRVAALRAHYNLAGEPKGATDLKIVPSSAPNLVNDHTQLVRELTAAGRRAAARRCAGYAEQEHLRQRKQRRGHGSVHSRRGIDPKRLRLSGDHRSPLRLGRKPPARALVAARRRRRANPHRAERTKRHADRHRRVDARWPGGRAGASARRGDRRRLRQEEPQRPHVASPCR
jgi:hypothetical protein